MHIFEIPDPNLSTPYNFYGTTMTTKIHLQVRFSPLASLRRKKTVQNWPIKYRFQEKEGLNFRVCVLHEKAHPCAEQRRLSYFTSKYVQACSLETRKNPSPLKMDKNSRFAHETHVIEVSQDVGKTDIIPRVF